MRKHSKDGGQAYMKTRLNCSTRVFEYSHADSISGLKNVFS